MRWVTGRHPSGFAVATVALGVAAFGILLVGIGARSVSYGETQVIAGWSSLTGPLPAALDGLAARIVMTPWIGAFGDGEIAIRLPSVVLAVGTLFVVTAIGRTLADRGVGLAAAVLLLISWPFLEIGRQGTGSSAGMFLVSLASLMLLSASASASASAVTKRWLAYGLLMGLSAYVQLATLAVLLAHGIWIVLKVRDGSLAPGRRGAGLGMLVAALLALPLIVASAVPSVTVWVTGPDPLANALTSTATRRTAVLAASTVVAIAVVALVLRSIRVRTAAGPVSLVALWALVPIGVAGCAVLIRPFAVVPAIAPVLPALALIAAVTIARLRPAAVRWVAFGMASITLVAGGLGLETAIPPIDHRAATSFLGNTIGPREAIAFAGPSVRAPFEHHRGHLATSPPPPAEFDPTAGGSTRPDRVRLVTEEPGPGVADDRLTAAGFVRVGEDQRVGGLRIRTYLPTDVSARVVVYGGTASGVMAAVSAARAGADTVLVLGNSPIGGMVASGLGFTDTGFRSTIGGMALEYFTRVGDRYGLRAYGLPVSWNVEPHVARAVFADMLREARVRVFEDTPLDRTRPPDMTGVHIDAIRSTAGIRFAGETFIDASYEGDLLAAAGVSHTIGRESTGTYSETLAGVRPVPPALTATERLVGTYVSTGAALPGISPDPLAPPGTGDSLVQPYTFRLCVTDDPANRVPFARPTGYRRTHFVLLERLIQHRVRTSGQVPTLRSLVAISPIPGGKGDLNSFGLVSTDVIGLGHAWAEADDAERGRLWRQHRDWVAGYLYFLAEDPSVPEVLRAETTTFGLCADEFGDTDHWPPQLYIREARRMVGPVVLTEHHILDDVYTPDPVAIGSYRVDVHTVQRVLDPDGYVRGEGSIFAPGRAYQIPLGAMLPDRSEAENLVVSVAISASHVAWSSARMEPVFMMLGESAGLVAASAAASDVPVQDVRYGALRLALAQRGARLTLPP